MLIFALFTLVAENRIRQLLSAKADLKPETRSSKL